MTAIKKKLTLLICIALSLLMIFVLSSCGNDEAGSTNTGNSNTNTDTSGDSGTTDSSTDDSQQPDPEPEPEPEPEPIVTYTVTFVQEGFANVVKTVNEGEALTDIPTPQAVQGYEIRWEEKDLTNIQTNITVNAVKTLVEYNVIYVLNGGTNNAQNPDKYTVEQELLLFDPSRAGYTFAGWYSDSSFNNNVIEIVQGTTGEKTFYANWTPNENTLVFDANGGNGTMANMTLATGGSSVLGSCIYTKDGYTFVGWSTTEDGGVEYETGDTYTMGTNSTYTLYAVWETIEYSITYDLIFDGVDNSLNTTLTYTVEDTITLKAPTKESFYFLGWYTEASFENKIDKIENRTGNITLYAKWTTNDTALTFTEAEGGYSVTGCVADIDVVIIPEIYNGSPVTTIGSSAFSGCTSLTSVEIPSSVTSIGSYAFDGCTSLTSVTIPSSVTTIGNDAFRGCTSLESITVDENNTAYKSIDGVLYNKDGTILICYPAGKKDTSFTIPNSVTSIGNYAFYGCTSLTSVEIPSSVTSIESWAFCYCTSLKSVEIPSSVTTIGEAAFEDCTSLESITIPSSVTSIEYWAFLGCTSLKSVNYLGTIEQWCDITFDNYSENPLNNGAMLYLNGVLVTDLVIPNTVTEIKAYAFEGCTSLESITIPSSVTTIGEDAFRGCTSLTSVEIPSSVTTIGGYAFYGCTSLTSITIPSSVTSIGSYAFRGCTSLTIYCEATSEPNEWNSNWNKSGCPVKWGHTHSYTNGSCECGATEN